MRYLKPLLIALVAIFAPAKAMLATALLFIVLDLITGVWAAKKRGDAITSQGLKRTVIKIMIYELAIALAFLCEIYLMGDYMPIAKIVSSFVGITELKSIYENLNEIGGGNLLSNLISRLNGPQDGQ